MDKIFSVRLDQAVLDEMERAARRLKMTKRRFLEEAIHLRASQLSDGEDGDVWSETLGAWRRGERPETAIRRARQQFQQGFERLHRERRTRVGR